MAIAAAAAAAAAAGANVGSHSRGRGRQVIRFAGRERVERKRSLRGRSEGTIRQVVLGTAKLLFKNK